jgi:membrane protein required for beta-lactamase induction
MEFLTVLIVTFFYLNWIGANPLRDFVPFGSWSNWCRRTIATTNVRFLACVGIPAVLVILVAGEIDHWMLGLPWLVLSVAVMIYAVDIHETDAMFEEQSLALDEADPANEADVEEQQDEFEQLVVYENFQGLYPPLFWFLLLGPAFALLYILARLYEEGLDDDDPEVEFVDQFVYWMEWPASRLSGLVFALVGHFSKCLDVFLRSCLDMNRAHSALMTDWAMAAAAPTVLGEVDPVTLARETNRELSELLTRTLFGWVGIAAVVAIMGW